MTREEAVEVLTRLEINNFRSRSGKTYLTEALIMAINALRTEPCGKDINVPATDAISRSELLKAIDTWDKFGCDADTKLVPYQDHYIPYIHYDDVVKCIKGMPSVQQAQKWIPVSERLPEDSERVLVTYGNVVIMATWDLMRYSFYDAGASLDKDFVYAWMPSPQPYKAESEG